MVIYKATNKIDGKVYIGQTLDDLNRRISYHLSACKDKTRQYYFVNALREYKKDGFIWGYIKE